MKTAVNVHVMNIWTAQPVENISTMIHVRVNVWATITALAHKYTTRPVVNVNALTTHPTQTIQRHMPTSVPNHSILITTIAPVDALDNQPVQH